MRTLRRLARKRRRGSFFEPQHFPEFVVERLDDAVASDSLMQNILNFGEFILPGTGAGADFPADLPS